MFWDQDHIKEDAVKVLKAFKLLKTIGYTFFCHLLNVASCVKQI